MKTFDEKFSDQVRDVFDQFHEEVDPVILEGMRVKLQAEKVVVMKKFYYRLLTAAMVLVIFSGLLYFGLNFDGFDSGADQPIALQNQVPNQSVIPLDSLDEQHSSHVSTPGITSMKSPELTRVERHNLSNDGATDRLNDDFDISQYPERIRVDDVNNFSDTINLKVNENRLVLLSDIEFKSAREMMNNTIEKRKSQPSNYNRDMHLIHTNYEIPEYSDLFHPRSVASQNQSTEFIVGSSANYANDQITQGAGFLAGVVHYWKINNTISLATGGLLAINHIQFSVDTHDQGVLLGGGQISSMADGDEFNLMVGNEFDLRYTAIDIPINTRYLIGTWGSGTYNFTIGLSSLVYIQQSTLEKGIRYSGVALANAESGEINVNISSSEYESSEKTTAFDSVDLAKLMNVSFGYSSARNQDKFEIELYIKYPLGDITSKNISIGMGGLTVKYRL